MQVDIEELNNSKQVTFERVGTLRGKIEMSVDIEELKRQVEYQNSLKDENGQIVNPHAFARSAIEVNHRLADIIAELESLREQVARKPDARRLGEVIVDKSHIWIGLPPNGMKDAITSIIERELGK